MQRKQRPLKSWGERVDDFIGVLSPRWAVERKAWRTAQQFSRRSFRGANHSRLGRSKSRGASSDYHLESGYDRRDMVDRARALERDNPIADGLLTRNVENVVHEGIKPQARTADPKWNKAAEELWTEEFVPNADVRGFCDFYDLQGLIQRSLKRDGDIGAIKLDTGQLQIIESDQLAAPLGKIFSPRHIDGIDLDDRGRPVAFHVVVEQEPAQVWPNRREQAPRAKIEAEDFMFLARRKRAGQTRGVTDFATAFEHFDQIEGLVEAVITAARMAACVGLMIKRPHPFTGMPEATGSDGVTRKNFRLEPAMVKYLEPGEEVTQVNPMQPSQNFSEFLVSIARILGLPFGLPLELLFMDFSRTNYSSARASLLQAYRTFRGDQRYLINHLCKPTWLWQVERWIEDGRLEARDDWKKHAWIPPGWAWVDPVKELQSEIMAVDANFKTVSEVVTSMGRDFIDTLDQREREIAEFGKRNIPIVRSSQTRDPLQPQVNSQGEAEPEGDESPELNDPEDNGLEVEDE
jgi:lambda family phage portal protein